MITITDLANVPDNLERHPLSAVFGDMPAEEYEALRRDIAERGQIEPIVLFEGMVYDGWHRYRACVEVGETVVARQFNEDHGDPVSYAISKNLHRRHLAPKDRAVILAKLVKERNRLYSHGGDRRSAPEVEADADGSDQAAILPLETEQPQTATDLAKEADVSPRTMRDALMAEEAGYGDKVLANELPLAEAAGKARAERAGDPPAAKPPTKMERLEARATAAEMDAQEKAEKIDELESRLRHLEAQEAPEDAVKMTEINRLHAEKRTLKSRVHEWQQRHADAERENKFLRKLLRDNGVEIKK